MARRTLALLGGALVAALAATPYFACNSITGINDYVVDCPGCLTASCGPQFALCQADPTCCAATACFQNCSLEGKSGQECAQRCLHDTPSLSKNASDMLSCVFDNCIAVCFGGAPGPDAARLDAQSCGLPETTGETSNETNADAPCDPDEAPPVDPKTGCHADRGSQMVQLTSGTGVKLCVDMNEVTWGDYSQFLNDRAGSTCGQITQCTWNDRFAPAPGISPPLDAGTPNTYPVYGIDWCDAYAYCKWAGKHLCGSFAGNPSLTPTDPMSDTWTFACTDGGAHSFPYGDGYVPNKCNTEGSGPKPTGSEATCVGSEVGFENLFDMSGNVREWQDACPTNGTKFEFDLCLGRGGSYQSSNTDASCAAGTPLPRNSTLNDLGFRCCAP